MNEIGKTKCRRYAGPATEHLFQSWVERGDVPSTLALRQTERCTVEKRVQFRF